MNEYIYYLLSEHGDILAEVYLLASRVAIFIHYMKNREQGLKSLMTPNVIKPSCSKKRHKKSRAKNWYGE